MKETVIVKVWERGSDKTKHITVPKNSDLKKGDYVILTKVGEGGVNENDKDS